MLTMTGQELRLLRVSADVKVYELAARMGVHSTRVSHIEALAVVTPETEARFRAALDESRLTTSSPSAAQLGHQTPQEVV